MKHYFDENGNELPDFPDPFRGVSPMHNADGTPNEERFIALGGSVIEDGELSPEERVRGAFKDLIGDLASKTDKITPPEFLAAARNGISSDLIAFARTRGVPEEVIAEGRARIVEIMADALRFGLTWAELIAGVRPV